MIEVRFEKPAAVTAAWVRRVVTATLKGSKRRVSGQVTNIHVLVTGDRQIRKINQDFLKHDYATDVISFGLDAGQGDIVVSVDMAKRVAKELSIPYREELARYLVHGTLHLLGYEDKRKRDHKMMHARQERILTSLLGRKKYGA